MTEISKPAFDKSASVALKGIAILMMMLHHNFWSTSLFESYTISFAPFSRSQVVAVAYACKICVSLFAVISGYGLYKSYQETDLKPDKWVLRRYIKTFSGYWFVWICSAILCQILNGRTLWVYFRKGKALG